MAYLKYAKNEHLSKNYNTIVLYQKQTTIKKFFFAHTIKDAKSILKDLDLSLEELKEIAKLLARKRGTKGYKNMSEDKLLSALISSKPVKRMKSQKQLF